MDETSESEGEEQETEQGLVRGNVGPRGPVGGEDGASGARARGNVAASAAARDATGGDVEELGVERWGAGSSARYEGQARLNKLGAIH